MPNPDPAEAIEQHADLEPAEALYAEVHRCFEQGDGTNSRYLATADGQVVTIERRYTPLAKADRPSRASVLGRMLVRRYDPEIDGFESITYTVRFISAESGNDTYVSLVAPRRGVKSNASAFEVTRDDGDESKLYIDERGRVRRTTDADVPGLTPRQFIGEASIPAVAEATRAITSAKLITKGELIEAWQRGERSEIYGEEAKRLQEIIRDALNMRGIAIRNLRSLLGVDIPMPTQTVGYKGSYAIKTAWAVMTQDIVERLHMLTTSFLFNDTKLIATIQTCYKGDQVQHCMVWFCLPGHPEFNKGEPVKLSARERAAMRGAIMVQLLGESTDQNTP